MRRLMNWFRGLLRKEEPAPEPTAHEILMSGGQVMLNVNGKRIICSLENRDEVLKAELKKLPGNKTLDVSG